MAKLGYLYLNNDVWDQKQVIPKGWIQDSTKKQKEVPESLWYFMKEYGYFWWIRSTENHYSFTALGWQGQFIYIIPDFDMVVAFTAVDEDSRDSERPYLRVIDNFIVPSVIK